MKLFHVKQGRTLTFPNGTLVCTAGESVPADHPAVLALSDPELVGHFLEHEGEPESQSQSEFSVDSGSSTEPKPEPEVEDESTAEEPRRRRGR